MLHCREACSEPRVGPMQNHEKRKSRVGPAPVPTARMTVVLVTLGSRGNFFFTSAWSLTKCLGQF